jgi:hypothetical protein
MREVRITRLPSLTKERFPHVLHDIDLVQCQVRGDTEPDQRQAHKREPL